MQPLTAGSGLIVSEGRPEVDAGNAGTSAHADFQSCFADGGKKCLKYGSPDLDMRGGAGTGRRSEIVLCPPQRPAAPLSNPGKILPAKPLLCADCIVRGKCDVRDIYSPGPRLANNKPRRNLLGVHFA